MVDEMPLPKQQRLGRRMDDRQYSALVSGRVLDQAGTPVAKGTAVLWKDGRGTQLPFSEGKYSISITAPGKYRIDIKGPGFAKASQELQVEAGKVYRHDFSLPPGGSVRGKVMDAGGRPLPEGDVFYRVGTTSFGIPIEQDGTYRIDGLAPGEYPVSVMVGEKNVARQVRVEAGKETVLDFTVR